jgi:hypothetical protein
MKKVIYLLLLIVIGSCIRQKPNETNKEILSWKIGVDVWGAPWDPDFEVYFSSSSDSMIVEEYQEVDDTIRNITIPKLVNRNALPISKIDKDSVYFCTKKIFKDFEFPTSDPGECLDGPCISVELQQYNTKLKCTYYQIDDIKNASVQVARLVNLINNKLEKEDKIY